MRLHGIVIVSIAVLTLSGVVSSQGSSTAEARLRAAMDKETVDGDLKAAADGYKQVISDRGANRAVVAQALLRLGMAHEKQGSKEANASYERLVREFDDQPTIVQLAKTRLAAAAAAAVGPTLRQVCSWECEGTISPDGRRLLFAHNGGLAVREIGSTGAARQIVPAPPNGRVAFGQFSPDGRRIVYTVRAAQVFDPLGQIGQIVVADADGRSARTLHEHAIPEGWSADGRRILALDIGEPRVLKLFWLTVANGTVQPIPTSAFRNMDMFFTSPDGRYIAFSGNIDEHDKENVYVMAGDGSGEIRLSPSPVYQEPVGWSRDGKYLLYGEFGDSPTLWAVPVANARVQGAPVVVRRFEQGVSYRGITSSGVLHYRTVTSSGNPYTASMDPASGKVTSVPAVLPTPGRAAPVAWSADSRRIAYLTGEAQQRELHVFSLDDGKDRRVPTSISFINSLCWPGGGDSILTNGIAEPGGRGPNGLRPTPVVLRVDLATGDAKPVFPALPTFRLWNCTETTAANNGPAAVKVRNIATGAETELYRLKRPTSNYGMSKISPDGRFVAFLESLDADTSVLLTVPSGGGPTRELARAKAPAKLQEADGHAWSHDSRFVYFLKRANSQAPYELYRVPATGGSEESMGLQGQELRGPEIAPNGRMVFFVMGGLNRPEIWAMENFLPSGK